MAQSWNLTIKPSFLAELSLVPPKEAAQITKKLALLAEDPTPDAKVKKHLEGKLHRLRVGERRLFYTFADGFVSVLALRKRDEQTYAAMPKGEVLGGGDVSTAVAATRPSDPPPGRSPAPAEPGPEQAGDVWGSWLGDGKGEERPLPVPITGELLLALRIPDEHHARLLAVKTEDELLGCPNVPEAIVSKVLDGVCGRPLDEVARQPDLMLTDVDDLLRYREGEVLGFLLRLSPEQQRFVGWSKDAGGPTLLEGGPGTGKSTVALHRARVLLEALRRDGVAEPRLLFTTYTNALVRFSEQLLGSLLGADARHVEVRTADSVAVGLVRQAGREPRIADAPLVRDLVERAVREAELGGNSLVQAAGRRTLERLGRDYLAEEISDVIEGRGLATLAEYEAAARPGRQVALNRTQRAAVWQIYETFGVLLERAERTTWERVRLEALAIARQSGEAPYDAVLVDEAQDLSPTTLELLVRSCRAPNRLFLTADANQAIYGAGFRWSDVHDALRFQGRTGLLRSNFRSTREIGEASESYLDRGALEGERATAAYVHSGPLPAVRAVADRSSEGALVARFFRGAARQLRLGLPACAVLCPSNAAAQRLALALEDEGLPARFMQPKDLDLGAPVVKTLTLKSAKGLEFPIVALAGFLDGPYPSAPRDASEEARQELTSRERRTLYVAMSRAMRALLVVTPAAGGSELLVGFDAQKWNLGVPTP